MQAQNVSNVAFYQEGNKVIITYDLDKRADVVVRISTTGGAWHSFNAPLIYVSGDVGKNVSKGHKRIVWDVLKERDRLVGNNIVFQVEATSTKPIKQKPIRQPRKSKYDGVGGFNKCYFQMYITAPFTFGSTTSSYHSNSYDDYYSSYDSYDDGSDIGMGFDASIGLRAKKFFFIGANIGYVYNMLHGSGYMPLGAHAVVYFPTGYERVAQNSYPFLSAIVGGYFGSGSGTYYQFGIGYDWLTLASFSAGYTGLRGDLNGNYFHMKIGFRLGKR